MPTSLSEEARARGIRYFLISYVDLFGALRAKLVPASAIDGMARSGAGFAGFASWLDLTPADPDVSAIPDPASLIQLPWKKEVGWLAADPWIRGAPLAHAPRNVLKSVIAKAAEKGLALKTGVECEFFLLTPDGQNIGDGADTAEKPCYDQGALMRRYDVIAEICDCMQELGWKPYQNDHEDGNGQFEMNWEFDDALVTADRQAFFKYMVKSIAEKHGLRATFMPKPFLDRTGTGCHAHASLWRGETNACEDAADPLGLSPLGYQVVAGLLDRAEEICAITNPTVNSYKRINAPVTLSGATWSPNTVSYAGDNRTHMIRVPGGGRLELRLADGATNPYLLPAVLLVAALDGIAGARHPGPPLDLNMYVEAHKAPAGLRRLPLNLLDALRRLDGSAVMRAGLGAAFVDSYVKLKMGEWNEYARHLTEWERATTLDC
ncbi:MAG: type III glutamate--ammonia ligase [Acetobacteraceae bacterium]